MANIYMFLISVKLMKLSICGDTCLFTGLVYTNECLLGLKKLFLWYISYLYASFFLCDLLFWIAYISSCYKQNSRHYFISLLKLQSHEIDTLNFCAICVVEFQGNRLFFIVQQIRMKCFSFPITLFMRKYLICKLQYTIKKTIKIKLNKEHYII